MAQTKEERNAKTRARGRAKTASTAKPLAVPKFTEAEAESIKQGLLSPVAEVRADTFVTVFGKVLPVVPNNFKLAIKDADAWRNVNASTFEVIGGASRHAMWADENPGDFYKQMGHTFAATASVALNGGNVYINTPVPKSELDDPDYIDAEVSEIDEDNTL